MPNGKKLGSIDIHREDGKVVGQVQGDTFFKSVIEKKHMLRKPPGWANDETALRQAQQAGAFFIEIHATDTDRVYRTAINKIWQFGKFFNRGYGNQLVLYIKHWEIKDPRQREMF